MPKRVFSKTLNSPHIGLREATQKLLKPTGKFKKLMQPNTHSLPPADFVRVTGVGATLWRGRLTAGEDLQALAQEVRMQGGRLCALWGSDLRGQQRQARPGFRLDVVFGIAAGYFWGQLDLSASAPCAPDLAGIFPAASRMQRATFDLLGIRHEGEDRRPWLRHGGWPADWFPLRQDAGKAPVQTNRPTDYEFVRVAGVGVHEIPVGPIHAGIIEPGHFRFSVIGERVLRLEQRLGYLHRGVERLAQGRDIAFGARLAGRVSGDSCVAHAWAYATAVETACAVTPSPRALALRALLLERERIANHLGDLGALGNDAALAFGFTHFMRLKEDWLRVNARAFGHRLLMDCIVPGGVAGDLTDGALLIAQSETIEREVRQLQVLYADHAGLQDRFLTTGAIDAALVHELSLTGFAARAAGVALDGRAPAELPAQSDQPAHNELMETHYIPPAPYDCLTLQVITATTGDVAARAVVRFGEIFESLRLIRILVRGLAFNSGEPLALPVKPIAFAEGLGVVEGWRGEVVCAVALNESGKLARLYPHDPSWQLWPALEHAVMNDIVPDFPLINKSFNLSYAGADL